MVLGQAIATDVTRVWFEVVLFIDVTVGHVVID